VVATERVGMTIATVMARRGKLPALAEAVETHFRLELPLGATLTSAEGIAFLGISPDRWLATNANADAAFIPRLEARLGGLASVVDQTGGLGILRLTGPRLFETLEKGVQIDVSPHAFAPGSVAVTSIAHIGVTLWKLDNAPTFEIAVARSLAASFFHWLEMSASAYGLSINDPAD
jgi:sarcosine oxidase subunit gamma